MILMLNSINTSHAKVRMEGNKILPFPLWDGVHMDVSVNVCVCAHMWRPEVRTGVISQALTTLCF